MSDNKPKPIPRKTPKGATSGGGKNGGMTMREQIAARRKAEAEGAGKAEAKPAAAPKKAAPKAQAAKSPAAKAAAPKKATPKRAARPTAAKTADADDKPARGSRAGARGGSSRSSAKRAGSGRSRRGDDDGDDDTSGGTRRGRRSKPEPKKKSPVPLIAAGAIVLGLGGAYAGGLFGGGDTEAAEGDGADTELAAADGVDADGAASGDADTAAMGGGTDSTADAPEDKPAEPTPEELEAQKKAEEEAKAKAEAEAAKTREEKLNYKILEPFGKAPESTDEEWATLQEKAAEFFDPDAGAAGPRAGKKLIAAGKAAWPAVINEMVKIDVDDPDGNRMGFRAADVLDRARGSDTGRAFDWRTAQDSASGEMKAVDLYFNKRLIIVFHETWTKNLADPAYWLENMDKSEAAAEAKARAEAKAAEADDEFGDIEIPDID